MFRRARRFIMHHKMAIALVAISVVAFVLYRRSLKKKEEERKDEENQAQPQPHNCTCNCERRG